MASLDGKQIVLVVGQKNYNEAEFNYLVAALENAGADVCIASNSMEKALGRLEGYAAPDCKIEEISAAEFDALILVGGYGARVYLWDDEKTHQVLRQFFEQGKTLGAISTAPVALANAGVLEGKRATVYPDYDSISTLEDRGAKHIHVDVVTDSNIITASHPRFVEDFTEAIIKKLKG